MTHARTLSPALTQHLQAENSRLALKLATAQSDLAQARAELTNLRALVKSHDEWLTRIEEIMNRWTGEL